MTYILYTSMALPRNPVPCPPHSASVRGIKLRIPASDSHPGESQKCDAPNQENRSESGSSTREYCFFGIIQPSRSDTDAMGRENWIHSDLRDGLTE